jgi:hypothetical protein
MVVSIDFLTGNQKEDLAPKVPSRMQTHTRPYDMHFKTSTDSTIRTQHQKFGMGKALKSTEALVQQSSDWQKQTPSGTTMTAKG